MIIFNKINIFQQNMEPIWLSILIYSKNESMVDGGTIYREK